MIRMKPSRSSVALCSVLLAALAACGQKQDSSTEYSAASTAPAVEVNESSATIPVTADNFHKAESAWNFTNWAKLGSDKALFHYREVSPTGHGAPTVRMNWDTLYSNRIVKVADDNTFSISLPDTDLYVSAHVIDENGFAPYYLIEKGVEHVVSVDTDYAWVLFRTEITDRHSDEALEAVHAVQDRIQVSGIMEDGEYIPPNYDQEQLLELRNKYKQEFLDSGITLVYASGPGQVDQHQLDLSHAAGWGGMAKELGVTNAYQSSPTMSGDVCRAITFDEPGNKFFTSFTLYDADGYLMDGNTFIRSNEWVKNEDGTITLHFNCGDDVVNPLSSGGQPFNYIVRSYGVSQQVMDDTWKPVHPQVVTDPDAE